MTDTRLVSAIGTPLNKDDSLLVEGLEAQLALQWRHDVDGVLAGGSMGMMQMLADETYADLVRYSAELAPDGRELMVGVGDTSFARTRDRIQLVNKYKRVDGVAVLTPYLWKFSQSELIDYYHSLADESRAPLFLYDLPQVTGLKVEIDTVLAVCMHPNIHGIKCSDVMHETRVLMDTLCDAKPDFRVIVAQPLLLDALLYAGVREHLDGVYALAPEIPKAIIHMVKAGEDHQARLVQRDLIALVKLVRSMNAFVVFGAIMNLRGIPGRYAPKPFRDLTPDQVQTITHSEIIQTILTGRYESI